MKKKLLTALWGAGIVCFALGVAGCSNEHTHTYGALVLEKPATCTQTGMKAHYYCEGCGTYFNEKMIETTRRELTIAVNPEAHTYGKFIDETPATDSSDGMQGHYLCECGRYFTADKTETTKQALTIPAGGSSTPSWHEHNYGTLVDEVPATCTTEGMHAYYYCEGCQTYFTQDKQKTTEQALKIGLKEHEYSSMVEEVPATCTKEGKHAYYQCSVCEKFFDENKVETREEDLTIGVDPTAHNYGEKIEEVPATCKDKGMQAHYKCSECLNYFDSDKQPATAEDLEIDINPNGHKWGDDNECEYCHKIKPAYTMSADGTKVYFGEYPQSEVTSSGLKVTLKMAAGIDDESTYAGWDEFEDFYESSCYYYKDVEYQGARYRGMYFTQYLKYFTWNKNYDIPDDTNSWQDNFGYSLYKLYWFKFEPIEWNILEQSNGTAVLLANIALDSYYFYPYGYGITDTSGDPRGDSWDISSLRKWLNGEFLNTVFDYESIQLIPTTHLSNYDTHNMGGGLITNYPDTDDKIYLLSNRDLTTYSLTADLLKRKATPYARFKNIYMQKLSEPDGYCRWWLRSTGKVNGYSHVQSIEGDQGLYKTANWYGWDVCNLLGVVPVLRLNLSDE